ncbi:copine-8-like isoform X1 [Ischnura elegans]|uniref:copine-8-like isoform X1 n=1 Tax=Ischnura elegans TaxID=197161 RepID=UPI001ED87AA8|nr:copine-8-like isoform X1 [Ischnura elegans]
MSSFTPGTAALPTSEVEMTISCRSLLGMDVFSKSDPMVVVYNQPFGERRWVEFFRTETIMNCHDPEFTKKLVLSYHFEEQQHLLFKVFDVDSSSSNLANHDFLGMATCTLGQVISRGKVQLPLSMSSNESMSRHSNGFIILSAEELVAVRDNVILQFRGRKLDRMDFFGKSDPFLLFSKAMETGEFNPVHKTEVIKITLNPEWKKFTIPIRTLCNGDMDRTIKIACYDWNRSGNHSFIGEFDTTLKDLSEGPGGKNVYYLVNREKMKKKSSYTNSGEIILTYYELQKTYSFLEYLKGGTQIHCSFAIDFTGSNGDPSSPDSLHYISSSPNSYEIAIQAVGSIIQDYDCDQHFPVLGFGARLPPDGRISHEFFVNMQPDNPFCKGVSGVLSAYHACIRQIQLYGPTNFAPVINHVAKFAGAYRDGRHYFILLIITDGVITDMLRTTQAIVSASSLPMSIIIVGVGGADFSAMEELDADSTPLVAPSGAKAVRDIVQFVPLRNFMVPGLDPTVARVRLAKEVLAEIPAQFLGYMQANRIVPQPAPQGGQPIVLPPDPELLVVH